MLDVATILKHYKNRDVQEQMVEAAREREVAVRFLKGFFGKRPDTLLYKGDVLEFSKKHVSSFHVSEEVWGNVNALNIESNKSNLDRIRKGWDFILDVDCPDWELSKLITHLLIKSLEDHNIKSLSLKFSGNKGFHIAVPFESFPKEFLGAKMEILFPEVPRTISEYLLSYIENKYVKVDGFNISFDGHSYNINEIAKRLDKKSEEMYSVFCSSCNDEIEEYNNRREEKQQSEFLCSICSKRIYSENEVEMCEKCNIVMDKFEGSKGKVCKCGTSDSPYFKFNAKSVIEVDTLLISTRHLYRLVYSLHEKSSLSSVPVEINRVLEFSKEEADPLKLDVSKLPVFLKRSNVHEGEAENLLKKAFSGKDKIIEEKISTVERKKKARKGNASNLVLEERDPGKSNVQNKNTFGIEKLKEMEELFPPCIKLLLKGIYDGKKRATFALINFFRSIGLDDNDLEKVLVEWNRNNPEPLKEGLLLGQLKYRIGRDSILPPNCDNKSYYVDIGVCKKDALCSRIKNPVNYYNVKHRDKYGEEETDEGAQKKKAGRSKLTEEQLAMRKAYRAKLKQEKKEQNVSTKEVNKDEKNNKN